MMMIVVHSAVQSRSKNHAPCIKRASGEVVRRCLRRRGEMEQRFDKLLKWTETFEGFLCDVRLKEVKGERRVDLSQFNPLHGRLRR